MKFTNLAPALIKVGAALASAAEQPVDWNNSLVTAFREVLVTHNVLVVGYRGSDCA